jgi:hypothetical protein
VVAKLCRLSREVAFISDLMASRLPFIVAELGAGRGPVHVAYLRRKLTSTSNSAPAFETLVRDFLACPPSLGEDYEVVIIAIAVDVARHLKCRGLERACAANVAGWLKGALGRARKVVEPLFILGALVRLHPAEQVIVESQTDILKARVPHRRIEGEAHARIERLPFVV